MLRAVFERDSSETERLFKHVSKFTNGKQAEVIRSIIKSYQNTEELYYSAVVHFAQYYIVAEKHAVDSFNNNRRSSFWQTTINALFDSGVMYISGMMDEGEKGRRPKNIRKLESCTNLLKNKPELIPMLSENTIEIYTSRLKLYRDKRLAHFEQDATIPKQYYDDPVIILNDIHDYLVQYYRYVLAGGIYQLHTLEEFTLEKVAGICFDTGLEDEVENIKKGIEHYFLSLRASQP